MLALYLIKYVLGLGLGLSPLSEEPEAPPVILSKLEHLEVISEDGQKSTSSQGVTLSGIEARNLNLLARSLSRFVGHTISSSEVVTIGEEIVAHCKGNGLPFVIVFLPEQDFEDGRLIIELEVLRAGEILHGGSSRLDDSQLLELFGLQSEDQLTGGLLQAGIDRLNRNPFRSADVGASEGSEETEVDLLIVVKETRPWQFFLGYDNSGNVFIREDRLFAGIYWGDAFGLDHEFNYQFTTSPTPEQFTAHAVRWEAPLPWHHRLAAQASLSRAEASVPGDISTFESEGNTWDLATYYQIPLDPIFRTWDLSKTPQFILRQSLSFGFEFRSTDNDVVFGGQSLFASTVDTAQFIFGYEAQLKDSWGQNELELKCAWSPGGLTSANDNSEFSAIRTGATANYSIIRGDFTRAQRLPGDFTLRLRTGFQWTNDELLPSEQLAIGGHATVRGLKEREFLADRGYWLSTELRLPQMEGLSRWFQVDKWQDQIQLYGFVDHAKIQGIAGNPNTGSETFSSTGIGLLWNLPKHLKIRLDHGWLLHGDATDSSRFNFGVTALF